MRLKSTVSSEQDYCSFYTVWFSHSGFEKREKIQPVKNELQVTLSSENNKPEPVNLAQIRSR